MTAQKEDRLLYLTDTILMTLLKKMEKLNLIVTMPAYKLPINELKDKLFINQFLLEYIWLYILSYKSLMEWKK